MALAQDSQMNPRNQPLSARLADIERQIGVLEEHISHLHVVQQKLWDAIIELEIN